MGGRIRTSKRGQTTMRTCGKILTIAGGGGVEQGILAGDLH